MRLILITNSVEVARNAEIAGVDRVMVDLEVQGKRERQGHLDTVISDHSIADVTALAGVLTSTELMVRVNPLGPHSSNEVDAALAAGARRLMLPMWTRGEQLEEFGRIVAERVPITALLETPAALARVRRVRDVRGIDEVHVGLNDLHLGLQLDFMFELVADGIVDHLAGELRQMRMSFGVGGVARTGGGLVSAELVANELVRVGADQVILTRDYRAVAESSAELTFEVERLRAVIAERRAASETDLAARHHEFVELVRTVAATRAMPST